MWQVDLSSTYHCETCTSWCDFGVPMWLLIGLLCSYLDFVWCCDSYVRSWNLCDIQVVKFFCGVCVGWLRFTCFTLEFSFADLVFIYVYMWFFVDFAITFVGSYMDILLAVSGSFGQFVLAGLGSYVPLYNLCLVF